MASAMPAGIHLRRTCGRPQVELHDGGNQGSTLQWAVGDETCPGAAQALGENAQQGYMKGMKTLEVNPNHPLIQGLLKQVAVPVLLPLPSAHLPTLVTVSHRWRCVGMRAWLQAGQGLRECHVLACCYMHGWWV